MVTLINRKRHIQVFNLPAPEGVEDTFGKNVEIRTVEELDDGKKGVKVTDRYLPGSLTLLAGETRKELPDWVTSCPEVKAALDRGALKLIKE